ncbi:transglycosylase SLT domain-containing protein [Streptomyces sp. HC44]|uniref:Transglycosylase SLT domain-containing protein n=1 Tax=Streptomyces scabichelini TaxID=2711217 RepID=A0A6G4V5K3_9ACTN|nr:transglycosylase SLT domain-containing protein [Streptomyces scabichelini]NGO09130.1 transglycosylase SLT domain-containing protein [Streptomyces scabichelini]
MPLNTDVFRRYRPTLTKRHKQKLGIAGVAGVGAAALAFSLVPGGASQTSTSTESVAASSVAFSSQQVKDVKGGVEGQLADALAQAKTAAAKKQAADAAAAKKAAEDAKKKAAADAAAKKAAADAAKKAEQERKAKQAASRSAQRAPVKPVAAKAYPNNLDGWIRESLDIMKKRGIPGSYDGIRRNIIRESSGNPKAINNWDINAINGIPSKGLLQVIPPTFQAYHVAGTSWNIYDPVANITAACNYAADRYGSMDNVNSAY